MKPTYTCSRSLYKDKPSIYALFEVASVKKRIELHIQSEKRNIVRTLTQLVTLPLSLASLTLVLAACGGGGGSSDAVKSPNGISSAPIQCYAISMSKLKGIVTQIERTQGVVSAFTLQGQRTAGDIPISIDQRFLLGSNAVRMGDGTPVDLAVGDPVSIDETYACGESTSSDTVHGTVVVADPALRDFSGTVTGVDTEGGRFTVATSEAPDGISFALADQVAYIHNLPDALQRGKAVTVQALYNRHTGGYTASTINFAPPNTIPPIACAAYVVNGVSGVVTAISPVTGPATSVTLQVDSQSLFATPEPAKAMTLPVDVKVVDAAGNPTTIAVGTKLSVPGLRAPCGDGSVMEPSGPLVVTPLMDYYLPPVRVGTN